MKTTIKYLTSLKLVTRGLQYLAASKPQDALSQPLSRRELRRIIAETIG